MTRVVQRRLLGEEPAREIFGKHEDQIERSIRNGWHRYERDYAERRHEQSRRTQSSNIRDLIILEMRAAFEGEEKTRWETNRGLECLVIEDGAEVVCVKFKKLDKWKRASNVPTGRAINFVFQQHLDGFPPATHFHAGWQVNQLRTAIDAIWITCPDGKTIAYSWPLAGVTIASVTPLVVPQAPTDETPPFTIKPEALPEEPADDEGKTTSS